jgi:hypothetical protein
LILCYSVFVGGDFEILIQQTFFLFGLMKAPTIEAIAAAVAKSLSIHLFLIDIDCKYFSYLLVMIN